MEWLIRETERGGPQLFKAGSSNPGRGASASLLFLPDLKSLTGEMIMAAPAPCGCRVYFFSTHLPSRHGHRPGRLLRLP